MTASSTADDRREVSGILPHSTQKTSSSAEQSESSSTEQAESQHDDGGMQAGGIGPCDAAAG